MLNEKERIKLGKEEYEVTVATEDQSPCSLCDIKDCYMNKDLDAIKARHFALSCFNLVPDNAYFKKVEQSPQVDCK